MNEKELKSALQKALPKDAFKKHPEQLIWPLALIIIILSYSSFIAFNSYSFLINLVFSIIIGLAYASFAFYAHEVMHGSITKNSTIQYLSAYLGFSLFCLSPHLWDHWHNRAHHNHTNQSGIDPDTYGLKEDFEKYPMYKTLFKQSPGSGYIDSTLFMFTRFTNQCLSVLWFLALKQPENFPKLNYSRAILETLPLYVFWIGLGIELGLYQSLFIILIPMAIANFFVMSYIATQHFLSPLGDQNNPLDNSISLKTFKVLDFMHFKFSYHTEHHFFPSLNHQYLPIISEKLKELKPDNYIQAPHISVIKLLYKTPRLYKDNKTLVHLNTKQEVKTDDIKEKLMSMS